MFWFRPLSASSRSFSWGWGSCARFDRSEPRPSNGNHSRLRVRFRSWSLRVQGDFQSRLRGWLSVDHQSLQRPEQARRAPRDSRQAPEGLAVRRWICQNSPPVRLDDTNCVAAAAVERQVLAPQLLAHRSRELPVVGDQVDLRVIEERVFIEIRRSHGEPLVVNDSDLCVHVDARLLASWRSNRAEQQPVISVRRLENTELTASVVVPVVWPAR